jgi:hypothetical protein
MSSLKPPTNAQHLRTLLTQWSKEPDAQSYGRLQRLVGVVVVAAMLDGLRGPDGNERIGYKGGVALELRFGFSARASKDLDAAYRGEIDDALELMDDALRSGWNGFTGKLGDREDILRAGIDPPPVRVRISLSYVGKHFMSIPFELSRAEGRSLDTPDKLPPAVSLAPARLPDPSDGITFLPLRYQIAQKLHACTEPSTEERANGRARDLHDLLLIEELGVEDDHLPAVREACVEIFAGRGKHTWPPQVTAPPGWGPIWDALRESEGLTLTLPEAIANVSTLVAPIDSAASAGA